MVDRAPEVREAVHYRGNAVRVAPGPRVRNECHEAVPVGVEEDVAALVQSSEAEDYADPAVEAAFQRAKQLSEEANALPPLLTALAGLHGYHAARAQLTDAAGIVPRMIELAERLPLPQASLIAHTCAAWLRWNQGELARAREQANQAITAKPVEPLSFPSTFDLVGYAFGTAAFVEPVLGNVVVARARSEEGRKQAGMELLARAEAHVRDTEERWYEAELHRLRGTIVRPREPRTAEVHFRQAIDVARAQGAKLWELRATVDLATMWRQEGKAEVARHLLQPVLSWFSHDVDAVDLQAARELYARLP